MAITFVQKHWAPPTNWRETLGPRVMTLDVPELDAAFNMAAVILKNRTDTEIQEIADLLVQSIAAAKGTTKSNAPAPDPRAIYAIYCTKGQTPPAAPIMEWLAVGTLLALVRACRAWAEVKITHQQHGAGKALAIARAFSEWLYIESLHGGGLSFVCQPLLNVRAEVKKAMKQQKSVAAKKGARKSVKPYKKLVIDYYEEHKPAFKSLAKAANAIVLAEIVDFEYEYSTIYTWLRAYAKAKKQT